MFRLSHITVSASAWASSWLAPLETWEAYKSMTWVNLKTVNLHDWELRPINSKPGVPTDRFHDSEGWPSNSSISSADRLLQRIWLPTARFNDFERRTLNATIWDTASEMQRDRVPSVKFFNFGLMSWSVQSCSPQEDAVGRTRMSSLVTDYAYQHESFIYVVSFSYGWRRRVCLLQWGALKLHLRQCCFFCSRWFLTRGNF